LVAAAAARTVVGRAVASRAPGVDRWAAAEGKWALVGARWEVEEAKWEVVEAKWEVEEAPEVERVDAIRAEKAEGWERQVQVQDKEEDKVEDLAEDKEHEGEEVSPLELASRTVMMREEVGVVRRVPELSGSFGSNWALYSLAVQQFSSFGRFSEFRFCLAIWPCVSSEGICQKLRRPARRKRRGARLLRERLD